MTTVPTFWTVHFAMTSLDRAVGAVGVLGGFCCYASYYTRVEYGKGQAP